MTTPTERAAREITYLIQQGRRRWMEVTPELIAETLERAGLLRPEMTEEVAGEIRRERLDRHLEYGEADPVNDFDRGCRHGTITALERAERIARGE